MKILFYDTKSYDKESFEKKNQEYPELQIDYLKSELVPGTAALARGYDAICAFVSSDVGTKTIQILQILTKHLSWVSKCSAFPATPRKPLPNTPWLWLLQPTEEFIKAMSVCGKMILVWAVCWASTSIRKLLVS